MNTALTRTENGALQLRSTGRACLDLFAEIGSARQLVEYDAKAVENLFLNAYAEDPRAAMAMVYWVRAVREGAGERDVFRYLLRVLYSLSPEVVKRNLPLVGELGYYKDYVALADELPDLLPDIVSLFAEGVQAGGYFACKWLPRRLKLYALVRAKLGMGNADFRRHVAACSNTVEQKLCAGKIAEVEYKKLPSLALNRYRRLFLRRDRERFLSALQTDKVNASVVFPHDVYKIYKQAAMLKYSATRREIALEDLETLVNAQWGNLPDYLQGRSVLTVLDTSGSMTWSYKSAIAPETVANALALYCAERAGGPFRDKIITFSREARFIDLADTTSVYKRMEMLDRYNICENTNLVSVFELILRTAREARAPREAMPSCVLLLSDMQFDQGAEVDITLMDKLKLEYKYAGYDFPAVVYWNLCATNTGAPEDARGNAALVSGFSPRILKSIFAGDIQGALNPLLTMQAALAPIIAKLDFTGLTPLPSVIAERDMNPTRGVSARLGA